MMALADILGERTLHDLLVLLKDRQSQVCLPDILSNEQWQSLFAFAKKNDSDRVEYYLELAEEKDEHIWTESRDDFDDEETYLAVKQFREQEYQLMLSLEKADKSRRLLAKVLADMLLKKETFQELLSAADDDMICLLKTLSGMVKEKEQEDGCYAPLQDVNNISADRLKDWGYAIPVFVEAWESEDSHRHVTGIRISKDVLTLFDDIYSEEFDISRRVNNIISNVCYTARSYYEVAPLDIVMKIFRNVVRTHPDIPAAVQKLGEQEFIDIARKVSKDLYLVYEYRNNYYIFEEFILDDLKESEAEEDSILVNDLTGIEEFGYDFYIPSEEEIQDFLKYGYWPDRESYQKLKAWLTAYYLETRELENMFPRMLALMGPEDSDEGYRERFTLDDVDESVEEKLSLTAWFFMNGCEAEGVMEEYSDIIAHINEDVKGELQQLLENCRQQTNMKYMLGNIPNERCL